MLPSWSRLRVSRLIALLAGFAVISVMVTLPAGGPAGCSVAHPCEPDRLGAVSAGLLFATMITAYLHWRTATWLATATAAMFMLTDVATRSVPLWTPLLHLGYAALFWYLPGDTRQPRQSPIAANVPVLDHRAVPWPRQVPRPDRHRWAGTALLAAAAVACAGWGVVDQARGDARQRSAAVVSPVVLDHPDAVTLRVALPDRREATVQVVDAASYPVGEAFPLYLDGAGFAQPVSEPYDATSWLVIATLLAAVAAAVARRGVEQAGAVRHLLETVQPVRAVRAVEGRHEVRLFHPRPDVHAEPLATVPVRYADPPDGAARWPRQAGHWTWLMPPGNDDGPDGARRAGGARGTGRRDGERRSDDSLALADLLSPVPVPALLYGDPRAGGWCAVEVNGRIRLPRGPAHAEDDVLAARRRPRSNGPGGGTLGE